MKALAHLTLVASSLVLLGLLPVPRTTVPPAVRCAATKMLAAGKATRARLACVANATVAGTDEDAGCHGRAEVKLLAAVTRVEAAGGCLTANDAPLLGAAVDSCVSSLRAALRPELQASACTGGKLKASGATALGRLKCLRDGVLRGGAPSAACLAKRDQQLDEQFAKLDPAASCLTAGDAGQIHALIDECVAGLMAPAPATTTTSLVVASTTTTTVEGPTTTSTSTSTTSTLGGGDSSTSTSSTTTTSTSSTTSSTAAYTCGGIFPLCGGTCPPMQTCGGLLCTCQL